jgi:hypothetical protein
MELNAGFNQNELSMKSKLTILVIDYLLLIVIISTLSTIIDFDFISPWIYWIVVYIIYYFLFELFFNQTLGMFLFRVIIINKKKRELNKPFIIYSLLIFMDRILLLILYIFRVLLNSDNKLLISEKESNIRWVKKKN